MALREVRAAPRSIASGGGEVEGDWGAVTGRPSRRAVGTSTGKKYLVTTKVGETTGSHTAPLILAGVEPATRGLH